LTLHAIAEGSKAGTAFIDAEHAWKYAERLGVDIEESSISQPDNGGKVPNPEIRSGAIDIVVGCCTLAST
jgi:RecA/RadA recombinase